MKFHFALSVALFAYVLARDKSAANGKGSRTGNHVLQRLEYHKLKLDSFFGPITKIDYLPELSAVVVRKRAPSQSTGAPLMSSCLSAIDQFNVGSKGIVSKNGVEYLYLLMREDYQATCFESYNNTVLEASDLLSCCDAAAKGGYNSFRFDGGVCTGFLAWLSPIHTQSVGSWLLSPGLFVAKRKLSNFTPTVSPISLSSTLGLARILVHATNLYDACPYSKTLKVTTYSKTETVKLNYFTDGDEYKKSFYLPELCDDSSSTAKRTVTISILDWDGSELATATEVLSNGLTGRHLLSNGVCVLHRSSPLRNIFDAHSFCTDALAQMPFGNGFLPFADLLQKLAGLGVQVKDFWTSAWQSDSDWIWDVNGYQINISSFNAQSLDGTYESPSILANVTDKLLYMADSETELHTVCVDAPYIVFDTTI